MARKHQRLELPPIGGKGLAVGELHAQWLAHLQPGRNHQHHRRAAAPLRETVGENTNAVSGALSLAADSAGTEGYRMSLIGSEPGTEGYRM